MYLGDTTANEHFCGNLDKTSYMAYVVQNEKVLKRWRF